MPPARASLRFADPAMASTGMRPRRVDDMTPARQPTPECRHRLRRTAHALPVQLSPRGDIGHEP